MMIFIYIEMTIGYDSKKYIDMITLVRAIFVDLY